MDPFGDFVDVMGQFVAKEDPLHAVLFRRDAVHPLLVPLPRVVVVHGKVGSGRTALVSMIRGMLYAEEMCKHVFVEDALEYSTSNKSLRHAIDVAMGATGLTIISTMPTKLARDGVVLISTRGVMSEQDLRSAYGIGIDRFMRAYDGNLVHLHNHRVFGIPYDRVRNVQTEPHTAHALEMCFRRAPCRVDDTFGDADICLERARRLDLDVPDTMLASIVAVLVGNPDGYDRSRDRKR
jgi:hypothetical protein